VFSLIVNQSPFTPSQQWKGVTVMSKPNPLNTIADIEGCMAHVMMQPIYPKVQAEFHRLLTVMGNVDGDEIIVLVMVAILEIGGPQS